MSNGAPTSRESQAQANYRNKLKDSLESLKVTVRWVRDKFPDAVGDRSEPSTKAELMDFVKSLLTYLANRPCECQNNGTTRVGTSNEHPAFHANAPQLSRGADPAFHSTDGGAPSVPSGGAGFVSMTTPDFAPFPNNPPVLDANHGGGPSYGYDYQAVNAAQLSSGYAIPAFPLIGDGTPAIPSDRDGPMSMMNPSYAPYPNASHFAIGNHGALPLGGGVLSYTPGPSSGAAHQYESFDAFLNDEAFQYREF